MDIAAEIKRLIENTEENDFVDFKKKIYDTPNEAFVKDVMSMANAIGNEPRYIIMGVKDCPSQEEKEICGIDPADIKDQAVFQSKIRDKIEPHIFFTFSTISYQDKLIGYFQIIGPFNRPYILKNDLGKIKAGDGYVRINSTQRKLLRRDYDEIYRRKAELLSIRLSELATRKVEIKNELLLIYLLKNELLNLIFIKNRFFANVKRFIELVDNPPRRMETGEIRDESNNLQSEILSFTTHEPSFGHLFTLLTDCKCEYYEQYAQIIGEIQSACQKLRSCRDVIQNVRSKLFEKNIQNNYFDGSYSLLLFVQELKRISDFSIWNYFSTDNRWPFPDTLLNFNANDRIHELQKSLDETQKEYDRDIATYIAETI